MILQPYNAKTTFYRFNTHCLFFGYYFISFSSRKTRISMKSDMYVVCTNLSSSNLSNKLSLNPGDVNKLELLYIFRFSHVKAYEIVYPECESVNHITMIDNPRFSCYKQFTILTTYLSAINNKRLRVNSCRSGQTSKRRYY